MKHALMFLVAIGFIVFGTVVAVSDGHDLTLAIACYAYATAIIALVNSDISEERDL